jgi:hypothetical protein
MPFPIAGMTGVIEFPVEDELIPVPIGPHVPECVGRRRDQIDPQMQVPGDRQGVRRDIDGEQPQERYRAEGESRG